MTRPWLHWIGIFLLLTVALLATSGPPAVAKSETAVSNIPFKRDPGNGSVLAAKVLGALTIVSILGVAGVYVLKRYVPFGFQLDKGQARRLKLVESLRVTSKTTLVLVELDGTPLLLAQSSETIRPLTTPLGTTAAGSTDQA